MTLKITKKRHQITFFSILTAAVLVSGAFTAIPSAYSQTLVFQDDYSTNAGWTQVSTLVTVDDPSFPDIVKFNGVPDASDRRVHKAIGTTLSDTEWILESEFFVNAHSGNPGHQVFVLSAGTNDPGQTASDVDMIGITYQGGTGDPVSLKIRSKVGTGVIQTHGTPILLGIGEQVYLRLSRTSATDVTLEVFSDAARTLHIAGSPVMVTDIPATIIGLDTLQHANTSQGGSGRNLTAEIDNTSIFDGSSGPVTCNGLTPTIEGTSGDEFLIGTPGDDVIVGLGGNDVILGNGGNDTICGGDGNDIIRGGSGDDTIFGDAGKDLILGEAGDDNLKGNGGSDRIIGGSGDDTIKGNAGDDLLVGNAGDDSLNGGNGTDSCDNTDGNDTVINCELSN